MDKFCSSVVLGAACTVIRDNTAKVAVCTSLTTNTVADVQANMLAETTLTTGASTSWTLADSSVSGRKITMTAQSSIAIATTGVAKSIALYSSVIGRATSWTKMAGSSLLATQRSSKKPCISRIFTLISECSA